MELAGYLHNTGSMKVAGSAQQGLAPIGPEDANEGSVTSRAWSSGGGFSVIWEFHLSPGWKGVLGKNDS